MNKTKFPDLLQSEQETLEKCLSKLHDPKQDEEKRQKKLLEEAKGKILTTEEYEKLDKKMKGKPVVKLSSDHTGKILKEVVKEKSETQ